MYGGSGNDLIDGGSGDDEIHGGAGNDIIYTRDGDDTVYAGAGNDIINQDSWTNPWAADIGNAAVISLSNSGGADLIYAGAGNDTINQVGAKNVVFAGSGDDDIFTSGFLNTGAAVDGGTGFDQLYFRNVYGRFTWYENAQTGERGAIVDQGGDSNNAWYNNDAYNNDKVYALKIKNVEEVYLQRNDDPFTFGYDTQKATGYGGDTRRYEGYTSLTNAQWNAMFSDNAFKALNTTSLFEDTRPNQMDQYRSEGGNTSTFNLSNGDDIVTDHWKDAEASGEVYKIYSSGVQRINGQGGNDIISVSYGDDFVWGGDGNDTIYGQEGNDTLSGGAGNDELKGGTGNDTLRGGNGNDYLTGGYGRDELYGDAGADKLYGGDGSDILRGGAGDDKTLEVNLATGVNNSGDSYVSIENIVGSESNKNILTGDSNANMLKGGDLDDTLYGGDGNDRLYGGSGSDILYVGLGSTHGGGGYQLVNGGADHDTYMISAGIGYAHIGYEEAGGGTDTINFYNTNMNNWNVTQGSQTDTLVFTSQNENGDVVYVHNASEIENWEFTNGRHFHDISINSSGNLELRGDGNVDNIIGSYDSDIIYGYGGNGNDHINGGDGNDVINVGLGDSDSNLAWQQARGQDGNDTYVLEEGFWRFTMGDASDAVRLDNGVDTIRFANTTLAEYEIIQHSNGHSDSLVFRNTSTGDVAHFHDLDQIENWQFEGGRHFHDISIRADGRLELRGDDNVDNILGSFGDDVIYGGDGNDWLHGGIGDDLVIGNAGDDTLYGNEGDDTFYFGLNVDHDVIKDFEDNIDTIELNNFVFADDLDAFDFATQSGDDVIFDFGNGDLLTVESTTIDQLENDLVMA